MGGRLIAVKVTFNSRAGFVQRVSLLASDEMIPYMSKMWRCRNRHRTRTLNLFIVHASGSLHAPSENVVVEGIHWSMVTSS